MTTITVFNRETGDVAVQLVGEFISETDKAGHVTVTVDTGETGEQYVSYDAAKFYHESEA